MLAQFYPPVIGGEERHVVTLSEGLAARGHEVTIATLQHPDRPRMVSDGRITVRSVRGTMQRAAALFSDAERPHAPPFPDPELTYELGRIVAAARPDVVHAHNWLSHSFLPLKRVSRAGFVVTLHDYSLVCARKNLMPGDVLCSGPALAKCLPCASAKYGRVVGSVTVAGTWLSGGLHRRVADRFIAVSRAVATNCNLVGGDVPYDILPTFIPDDVGVLKPGVEARLAALPPPGYLLYVGDLTRGKGVHVLLDAYARLADAPPLVMIGRRCPDMPTALPPNVTVHESWPHAAVMHAWSRCLFGIAPSVWAEACGTIVMEGNSVGRPMIASDIGGLSDLVEPGRTGLLTPAGDAAALAAAMQGLIDDPARRERMGEAARAHVERFMAKSIVPRIERIYREVASRPRRRVADRAGAAARADHVGAP